MLKTAAAVARSETRLAIQVPPGFRSVNHTSSAMFAGAKAVDRFEAEGEP